LTWFREKDSPDLSEPLRHIADYIPFVQRHRYQW
jgi:hypothetical protein